MHVSASNDGGPHTTIAPSTSWNPSFTVMDRAATYWYHPHLHEKTNEHVTKGLAGFIIVRDEDEAELELPRTYGVDDFPLVIQTKDFDANNQVIWHSNADDVLMVNATIDPALEVPAQVIRLRLLNGSSQRFFNIGLSGNHMFYQIGSDDGLLSETNAITRLQMAPGERAEILLNLTGMENQTVNLMSYAAELSNGIYGATYPGMMSMMTLDGYNPNAMNGNNFDILELNIVEQTDDPVLTIPTTLVDVTPIPESEADLTRTLTFTPELMGPNALNGKFYINGVSFDMNTINYTIPLGNVEIWTLTNQSPTAHPFHIHDVHFFILDRNGNPPPLSEQGRKDVVFVPAMSTVRFITQFTDYADEVPYMYHCHMLVHEDDGMMGQFVVEDEVTNLSEEDIISTAFVTYPNPLNNSSKELNIKTNDPIQSVRLVDLSGRIVHEQETSETITAMSLDLSYLSKGIYLINVVTGRGIHSDKIIMR
jgi:bilirubin oxidase